ncbi:adenine nucleotide alpha hydrolases-like protein [Lindgomyces ingoldianus]|uniref:Adenine nucleotide alpha hydrolases-like protein n=1 Tax=Lindgomyces ingoldianus TaxID=673940 RepID=A0ACB6R341_9PLEO|nr:adenine nucleotide alpha hydrolases-like protein [Lindgomyces ingoldianus]KAF2473520.1 adenine nucleotide alpha hydrolases-like protein [Lindgomyces ingoldianus]
MPHRSRVAPGASKRLSYLLIVFQSRVSFDTFDKPADFIEENSFTLIAKHKDYEYTKRSRTFLCGCDDNEYSEYALQWLIDELVDDGDEIVCLRVVEKDSTLAADPSVEKRRYRSEAETLMKQIQNKNHENKAINLILEFAVGKVNIVIDEMINLYEPAILVVGTRGRSLGGFQGLLPGSVSKYCLQHSPVPVIVVRPSSKRDKSRTKRAQDPARHAYKDLLEKSGPQGGHILNSGHRNSSFIAEEETQPASDDEAVAVAAAIGLRQNLDASPLTQVETTPADVEPFSARVADTGFVSALEELRSPSVVMKSPELGNLDSPDISDISSSEEDDQGGVSTTQAIKPSIAIEGTESTMPAMEVEPETKPEEQWNPTTE